MLGSGGEPLPGLRAGTSAVALPLAPGWPMMGYGARQGVASGTHDPLFARALYASAGDGRPGDAPSECLIVECDLCLLAPAQARAVRERLASRTGVGVERILVGCIHTHSGPETGFGAVLGGQEPPAHVGPLLDAAVEAGVRAVEGAQPARLGVGHAAARIGRNRRRADGPLDEDVLVVRVDRASGDPLALLYVHGCHPTALGHDNLAYSADWPGVAARALAERFPGVNPVFALGAHADVDPRTRGLLDLAIPGQSVGVGFEETEALGREVAAAVADAAAALETRADVAVGAAAARLEIPALREAAGDREAALEALGLPADAPLRTHEFFALEHERTAHLPEAERRERIARVRLYLRNRTARRFAFGERPEVEVQVLRLGTARLLALPAEPTVDVGLDWKARAGADAAVVGIANGWIRYLPHPRNFDEPGAHQKYEILQASLEPGAAVRLLDEAERLDAALGRRLPA